MAKEKLEELSTQVLMKRKKFMSFIIGVIMGLILVTLFLLVKKIINDEIINFSFYGTSFGLFFFILFFYSGIKKINLELIKRETTK